MSGQLQRLLPRHQRVIDLCLEGLSGVDIAKRMGMTNMGISLIVNSPIFQTELSRRRDNMSKSHDHAIGVEVIQAKRVLEGAAVEAAEKHVGLLGCEDDAIAQRSASEILNRVGLTKVEKKDSQGNVTLISIDTLNVLQEALEEADELEVVDASVGVV